ncbi:hypothetical protein SAMN04488550_1926 [Gordonia malaquae]|nr:hypothetical protein SAMN04488550_1926 [Gordonia malaquae]
MFITVPAAEDPVQRYVRSMTPFTDRLVALLPAGIVLPQPILTTFDWLADNGHVDDATDHLHARLVPVGIDSLSEVAVDVDPDFMTYWHDDESKRDRVIPLFRTGGDGSHAGLWVDDDGRSRFVHLGSGSGSTWSGVSTDDAVDFLRFLAIGYDEPCWPEAHALTPEEVYAAEVDNDDPPFTAPTAFQTFLRTTFAVDIPDRGVDIVTTAADMDDDPTDPFLIWLADGD